MKNFFKGISLSSIAAGALAAVTSFLLSAKIGIAGSVIGVAIGSIVSAVSSQIYQNVLHESGRKLQDVAGTTGDGDDGATETAADTDTTASTDANAQDHTAIIANPVALPAPASHELGHGPRTVASDAARRLSHGDETQLIGNAPVDADATIASGMPPMPAPPSSARAATPSGMRTSARPAAARFTASRSATFRSEADRAKRNKRTAIIVAVISALVAVGATAGVILAITQGQGNRYCGPRLGAPVEHPDDPSSRHRRTTRPTATATPRIRQRGRHRFDRQGLDGRQQQLDQQWQWIDQFHSGQRF